MHLLKLMLTASGKQGVPQGGVVSPILSNISRAESFGFLGFDFRRLRSLQRQVWRAHYTPKLKKRTALLRKLKEVFRRYQSQPVDRVVDLIIRCYAVG